VDTTAVGHPVAYCRFTPPSHRSAVRRRDGGRAWWAHRESTRINIELTFQKQKIEENDLLEAARVSARSRLASAGAGAPPFPGNRLDGCHPRPWLIILDWSPSRRVGVRCQIAVSTYLTRETFCSGSRISVC
jgi:hypothetical protein